MDAKDLHRRMKVFFGLFIALAAALSVGVLSAPSKLQVPAKEIVGEVQQAQNRRGSFYDANGLLIASSEKGSPRRSYPDALAFGSVIGYSTGKKSGLEKKYNTVLTTASGKEPEGDSITLTLRTGIQTAIYDQLKKYRNAEAAIVVMNAKTGEVLGLGSAPALNIAALPADLSTLPNGSEYNNAAKSFVPGSVIKLVTSGAIVRQGLQDTELYDTGEFIQDGWKKPIRNFGNAAYQATTLVSKSNIFKKQLTNGAIGKSINTYFAKMAVEVLDPVGLDQMFSDFGLTDVSGAGAKPEALDLDFASISAQYSLKNENGVYTSFDLAQTAFGQGRTLISPVHVSMITAAIANGGKLVKPYMIKHFQTPAGRTYKETRPSYIKKNLLSGAQCKIIQAGMKEAAQGIGFSETSGLRCKTGSGEITNNYNAIWITSYFEHEGELYVITAFANKQPPKTLGRTWKDSILAVRNAVALSESKKNT